MRLATTSRPVRSPTSFSCFADPVRRGGDGNLRHSRRALAHFLQSWAHLEGWRLQLWHYAREGGVGGFEDFSYSLPDVDESALDQSSSASGSANDAPYSAADLRFGACLRRWRLVNYCRVSSARDARPVLAQLYLDSGGYLRLFASPKPVTEQSLAGVATGAVSCPILIGPVVERSEPSLPAAPSKSGGGTQAEAGKPIADEPQSKTGVDYLQSAQAPKKETISACNCDPSVLNRAHEAKPDAVLPRSAFMTACSPRGLSGACCTRPPQPAGTRASLRLSGCGLALASARASARAAAEAAEAVKGWPAGTLAEKIPLPCAARAIRHVPLRRPRRRLRIGWPAQSKRATPQLL